MLTGCTSAKSQARVVSSAAASPSPEPATQAAHTWTDVSIFGAGDGKCPGGDDTACIQAAIDSLPRGGTVYFPPAVYVAKSSIRLADTTNVGANGGHPGKPIILQGAARDCS